MTVEEILCGKGETFPGLVPLIEAYLDIIECDEKTCIVVNDYIDFLIDRSKGTVSTTARWIRDFISNHPSYKKDSVVTKEIEHDLVRRCVDISNGKVHDATLLGDNRVCPIDVGQGVDRLQFKSRPCDSLDAIQKEGDEKEPSFKRLRGASFQEDVGMTQANAYKCAVVRALVEKYKSEPHRKHVLKETLGFANTPAFLPSRK